MKHPIMVRDVNRILSPPVRGRGLKHRKGWCYMLARERRPPCGGVD